jgi:hypothetical protein
MPADNLNVPSYYFIRGAAKFNSNSNFIQYNNFQGVNLPGGATRLRKRIIFFENLLKSEILLREKQ